MSDGPEPLGIPEPGLRSDVACVVLCHPRGRVLRPRFVKCGGVWAGRLRSGRRDRVGYLEDVAELVSHHRPPIAVGSVQRWL